MTKKDTKKKRDKLLEKQREITRKMRSMPSFAQKNISYTEFFKYWKGINAKDQSEWDLESISERLEGFNKGIENYLNPETSDAGDTKDAKILYNISVAKHKNPRRF